MSQDPETNTRCARPWLRAATTLTLVATLAATGHAESALAVPTEALTDARCRLTQLGAPVPPFGIGYGTSPNALSADGILTLFVRQASDDRVSLRNSDTGHTRVLGRGRFDLETAVISPSGTKAAVSSLYDLAGDGHRFDRYQLFVQNLTRRTWRRITPGRSSSHAVGFSANGRRLLYVTNSRGLDTFLGGPVRVVNLRTGSITTVVEDAGPGPGYAGGAAISPDGTKVVFLSDYDHPDSTLRPHTNAFLYDLPSATFQPITTITAFGQGVDSVAFTDDGATVAFATDQQVLDTVPAGTLRTYLYDLASGATTLLSDRAAGVDTGQLSPDGTRIIYRADADPFGTNPDGTPQLFSHDIATGATTQLTRGATRLPRRTDRLTWPVAQSINGTVLAFNTNRNLTGANPNETGVAIRATTCDPPPRPDAAIATTAAGPHTGDDTYSAIATPGQELALPVEPGQTATFHVRVENERAATDTLRLKGVDRGDSGYRVRYRAGTTDITAAVQAGTYRTGPLEPGQSATIKIKLTALAGAAPATTRTVDLTAISTSNPVARDTVRAKATTG